MENPIYQIIKNRVEDKDTQLFFLDAPTGIGKTYQVIRFIQDNYPDKKIFFIANQLKLLPTDEELTRGMQGECRQNLEAEILRIPSIPETFKSEFKGAVRLMPSDFKLSNQELIKGLLEVVESLLTPDGGASKGEIDKLLIKNLRDLEREFRKNLKTYLKNKQIKKKEIISSEWITKLYPGVLIEKKNIILMSTKRFFLPVDPIYASSYMLYNKSFANAVLFIDEVDATKSAVLETIIDQKKNEHRVECFRLYRSLKKVLDTGELQQKIALWDIEGKTQEYLENISKQFNGAREEIGTALEYQFKTDDKFPLTRNFIFNDNKSIAISKTKKCQKFIYRTDHEKKINYVSIAEEDSEEEDLGKVFTKVLECIDVFVENMIFIVDSYQKRMTQIRRPSDPEFENQDACATLIDILNIGEENKKYLVSRILEVYSLVLFSGRRDIEKPADIYRDVWRKKYDFYQNGFSYLEIKDDYTHNLESKCFLYSYSITPEKLLASTAKRYKVIGISATSTYDTVLLNYDLQYLQYVLRKNNLFLNGEEKSKIREIHQKNNERLYKNTHVSAEGVAEEHTFEDLENFLKRVYGEEAGAVIKAHREALDKEYDSSIVLNIYHIFSRFLSNDSMFSFLFFVNANMKKKSATMSCMTEVMKRIETSSRKQAVFRFLDSNGLEEKYSEIKEKYLEKGYKVFIITPYQTMGTGVNLQYKITEQNVRYYPVLGKHIGEEKDYDGIYLSKPTQVFPSLNGTPKNHETVARLIYSLEYLRVKDHIKEETFERNLEAVFRNLLLHEDRKMNLGFYKNYRAICYGSAKILVQAIGRICRQAHKGEHIQVYYERKNGEYLLPILKELKVRNNNYEFDAVLNDLENQSREMISYANIDEMREVNNHAGAYIDNLMPRNGGWTKRRMAQWKMLREFVLQHPTFNENEYMVAEKYYFRFPEPVYLYTYDKVGDLQTVSNRLTKYRMEVSMFTSGAYWALEKIDGLQQFFVERGYAVMFKPNPYILSPELFQRIYKGAVGEVVGEYLLNKHGIVLKEIERPEHFEIFDFQIGNSIYVDFKNWHANFERDLDEELKKVDYKAKIIGATHVFIINNLYQGYERGNEYTPDKIKITTISWLYNTYDGSENLKDIKKIKKAVSRDSLT